MPTPGKDCDITLAHPLVNGGEPVGFMLHPANQLIGPEVRIHHEVYTDALAQHFDVRHLWFDVLIADELLAPDGSRLAGAASQMLAHLTAIAAAHTNIALDTRLGVISGLSALQHALIYSIRHDHTVITVHLTTHSANFQPANPAYYFASVWQAADYSGEMDWNNSYWR
ncbi:MAG: hypothetical protein HPY76_00975 [Anaerolineae bacterium]|jgi:hypothetical protein|nr:hypothetical protein [Anaerolineae bacterium]